MRRLFSGPGELDADDAAERHRSAAGHAGGEVRVFVREEAPAVVPDDVKPRDGIAIGVDRVHVRVDLDPVHRAENVARVLRAIERGLVDGSEAEGFLAVVLVNALPGKVVVALDRALQFRGREAELSRKLLNRIGLHDEAFFEQFGEHLVAHDFVGVVGIRAVLKGIKTRAAVHLELLRIRGQVAVEERVVAVALLVFVGVENVFVGAVQGLKNLALNRL